jgi:DNA mismatch repair protein MutL
MYLNRINLLSEDTSNKIAAGEVVERPYSVVKELIENSIDAQAKNITIEVGEGGQRFIKVLDDGIGINPEDIEKAFLPHATSKISIVEDIYNITTMGFRGEALASIAAVSETTLRSRTSEYTSGKEISINGGGINFIRDVGMNIGTYIEVKNLFFNVPARLKFLKSSMREAAAISDIISRIALANNNVSFKLFNNEKKVLHTYGNSSLTDCIRSIYGKNVCENMIYFENHSDVTSVHGYIGNAEISRGSRNNQSIFVNNRYIKNKLITAAVENAFKSFLTINKFPFSIVFVDIFPEFIDVNIHPTKSEIKFRDDREIFKLVFDGVHKAIKDSLIKDFNIPLDNSYSSEPSIKYEPVDYFKAIDNDFIKNSKSSEVEIPIDLRANRIQDSIPQAFYSDNNFETRNKLMEESVEAAETAFDSDNTYISKHNQIREINNRDVINEEDIPKLPSLEVIGQFNKTYIIAQAMGELYIIDQHAAHEKLLFEKFKKDIEQRSIAVQLLITPVVVELSAEDYFYFIENKQIFNNAGFVTETFGDNTITVREVPYILGKLDIKNFFIEVIDNLKNLGSGKTTDVKYQSIAKMACRSAIKANDALSETEIKSLMEQIRFLQDPFNCPHGRPTIIKVTLNELEKRFKRVQ